MGGTMIQDPAAFVSTDFQRAVTTGLFASCAALVARGGVGIELAGDGGDPAAWASLVGSGLLAYWLSDLGTGVFHWSVDNYGSKATPVMGGIIDAFQGHHKYPWTITKRQFANNIHTTCPATMCVTVPLLLTPGLAPDTCAFMGVFCSMIVLSQQFHAWSHMKKSQLPEIVVKLQDLGVLISRKGHGAHHRPPFEGNYCIVSGWWNPIMDDNKVFNKMEKVVYEATGVAPRSWSNACVRSLRRARPTPTPGCASWKRRTSWACVSWRRTIPTNSCSIREPIAGSKITDLPGPCPHYPCSRCWIVWWRQPARSTLRNATRPPWSKTWK